VGIAAAGGIRRYRAHDQHSCVPINHGATTVTSSISPKPWNEARSINDVRGSMVTEGREWACIETYIVIVVILLLSSCDATLERRKECANILADCLQSNSALAHPSSQASASRRDGEGAIREATSPTTAAQKRHAQPSMCVGASPRGRVSPLVQLLQSCGLRPEGDNACAALPLPLLLFVSLPPATQQESARERARARASSPSASTINMNPATTSHHASSRRKRTRKPESNSSIEAPDDQEHLRKRQRKEVSLGAQPVAPGAPATTAAAASSSSTAAAGMCVLVCKGPFTTRAAVLYLTTITTCLGVFVCFAW